MVDCLLAKSMASPPNPAGEEQLVGHTALVVRSAEILLEERGRASLAAHGLSEELVERLTPIVRVAAFAHDAGKANDHFQAMVRHQRSEPQLVRHEALAWQLFWPGQLLSDWLGGACRSEADYLIALAAAVGHHRKFMYRAFAEPDSGAGTELTILAGHPDFLRYLDYGRRAFGIGAPPKLTDILVKWDRRQRLRHAFEGWADRLRGQIAPRSDDAKLLAIAKALVISADVAGSALPRASRSPSWVGEQLRNRATTGEIASVVRRRLAGKDLRPFQCAVADSSAPVTLVRAGCGSGKTAAAYEWCARNHAGRQLWITYPTTGTATEGFRDYLFGADLDSALVHSRADVDLDVFSLRDDDDGDRTHDRLEALRAWGEAAVSCTVDTVLGLLQNQRRGLYAWPGIAHSAIVFDEVHAYDGLLFGLLLRFIEELPGVPALLMTASLPSDRLESLRRSVLKAHGVALREIAGPTELEALPRYQRMYADDPASVVRDALASGQKVLWVSNTVNRAIDWLDRDFGGPPPIAYHSRFRYLDRVERHGEVINAFRRPGPALALTTQVAEMSLDLSADLLITDHAPIPALIQRLGRLNRRSTPEHPEPPKPFLVLPFEGLPYDPASLEESTAWLKSLGDGALGQRHLVDAWRPRGGSAAGPELCAWIDGVADTKPEATREASPGVTVLLAEDVAAIRARRKSATACALPMNAPPRSMSDWRAWPREGGLLVAPQGSIHYDSRRGARWQRE